MKDRPCALRALSLCDGQVLEDEAHALRDCLCAAVNHAEEHFVPSVQAALRAERQELIEKTLAPPLI